jgi:hypothetical protein
MEWSVLNLEFPKAYPRVVDIQPRAADTALRSSRFSAWRPTPWSGCDLSKAPRRFIVDHSGV